MTKDYVYLERKDLGASLSSWINSSMGTLNAAFAEGLTGYVHWPAHRCPRAYLDADAFSRRPNMFAWYFDQPWCHDPPAVATETWVYEDAYVLTNQHPIANLEDFFQQYLVFNVDVIGRFEALLARYRLRPEQTIAVSWRGTDNVADGRPQVPIDSFFPVIDEILGAEPGLTIVAKPEERSAADALRRRYPNVIVPSEFFIAEPGETQMQDWVNPASGYERGMEVALLILLFARCRYLLKNNANLSDIATRLSSGTVFSWTDASAFYRMPQRPR